ncbi:MAG: hypothetical protein FJZ01_11100, partial [Candidatus Sericytochromatia bacterium]|nr:hypothetical protein [Candidatus Tanganyikabacteria bacterium]
RRWHPLAARLLAARGVDLAAPVLDWLGDHEPETAIGYLQARGDASGAVRLIRRRGIHLLGEGIGAWLAGFPPEVRRGSLELAALEAAYRNARGEINDGVASLEEAVSRLRHAAAAPALFVALLELLYGYWLKQDFPAFGRVEGEAAALAETADFADRIRYWNLQAICRFDAGEDEAGEDLTRRILAAPHFGQSAIAYIQQMAALNLGVREAARGRPEEAARQFHRALALAREYPHHPSVAYGAQVYLAACLFDIGQVKRGAALLAELPPEPPVAVGKHREAVFRALLGHSHGIAGDAPRAAAYLDAALGLLTDCGLGESQEAAGVLNEQAMLHRRRGEFASAESRHAGAIALAAQWPHVRLGYLVQQAATRVLASDAAAALEAIRTAAVVEAVHPAPHHRAALDLLEALLARRAGDGPAAARLAGAAVQAIVSGSYFHLWIAFPELVPELRQLVEETGHGALAREVRARFPEVAEWQAGLPGRVAAGAGDGAGLAIRCFGTLDVLAGGKRVEAWPRKRSKALLACLLTAPQGLSREELFEKLFPEADEFDPETRLNLLASSLRKILEPDLAPRGRSRYLEIGAGRLRLDTRAIRVDMLEFEDAYQSGAAALAGGRPAEADAAFRRACELYAGDLFAEPLLQEICDIERHRCKVRVARMLLHLAERAFAAGAYEIARAHAERLLGIDATNEEAHRQLMRIYRLFGQEDLLERQFRLCERILRQELDLEPSGDTRELAGR